MKLKVIRLQNSLWFFLGYERACERSDERSGVREKTKSKTGKRRVVSLAVQNRQIPNSYADLGRCPESIAMHLCHKAGNPTTS